MSSPFFGNEGAEHGLNDDRLRVETQLRVATPTEQTSREALNTNERWIKRNLTLILENNTYLDVHN